MCVHHEPIGTSQPGLVHRVRDEYVVVRHAAVCYAARVGKSRGRNHVELEGVLGDFVVVTVAALALGRGVVWCARVHVCVCLCV